MKTLIIPDIHTRFPDAESIISSNQHDNIVFLGDYFDAFYDTILETKQVAEWLKDSLKKKNRLHLLGNHDLAYKDQNHLCSGFTLQKLAVIKESGVDLTKLEHYCWVDDWLCTHAGLSNEFFQAYNPDKKDVNSFLADIDDERLYDVSVHRGGRNAFGGILWCDYDEFTDIDKLKQIFGHTKGGEVRHKHDLMHDAEHYCIDTSLQNFALYDSETNEMKVKESNL